jgi:adenylate kinase family enzyme
MTIKKFNKILILGNGGSGKSTLARRLGKMLSIPILHLDKIYWINQWQKNDLNNFDQLAYGFLKQEKWIIEGTPMRGIEDRIKLADLIILIDKNRIECIFQVLKRRFLMRNIFDDGCPAIKMNLKTLIWIWCFKRKIYPTILEKLQKTKKELFLIKNNKEISLLIKRLATIDQTENSTSLI